MTLPEGQQFSHVGRPVLALSRDGTNVVYVANRRLFSGRWPASKPSVIPGSELPDGVQSPAFSPDGQWIVFRSVGDSDAQAFADHRRCAGDDLPERPHRSVSAGASEGFCSASLEKASCDARRKAARPK